MDGIVIWAHSICRSVMALYREMGIVADRPIKIALWKAPPADGGERVRVGFRSDEFLDLDMTVVGEDYERGCEILNEHTGWLHLFCAVQVSINFRRLLLEGKLKGIRIGVMCESPCNMMHGYKGALKEVYLRTFLRWRMRNIIAAAEFFVSYSGSANYLARRIGWPEDKIIPFGYFPPPIEGSSVRSRKRTDSFHILATGALTWYRGADILVAALCLLKEWGVQYEATITQDGELLAQMKEVAERANLPIVFPGFVPMDRLIRLYETCSVYVGAGRSEPWGMRLNDALNCGAPLVVSKGMGGVRLVEEYGCGLSFEAGDSVSLAVALKSLAEDDQIYMRCAEAATVAAGEISPRVQAERLMRIFSARGVTK